MPADFSNSGFFYNRVALIGTGMIGGSIGIALRERRLVKEVTGFDRDRSSLEEALRKGAVDSTAKSPAGAVRGANLVILAVPVSRTVELLKEIVPFAGEGTVITDAGSTKSRIMTETEDFVPPSVYFIGGHPMAGSEESGIGGADPGMLENAIYVLTPGPECPAGVVEKLEQMIRETGAQPLILDPEVHDRVVASVSHLPQVVSAALVRSVAGAENMELVRTLAAGGFRDSTRIALSDPALWRDICLSNRGALDKALSTFRESIDTIQAYLAENDEEAIEEFFRQARDYRRSIPHRGRGILPELYDIIVLIRDTPGAIGHLAGLLGGVGINIDAIEILHVRELAGGSIRLGFRDAEQQQQALELLHKEGYSAHSK